VTTAPSDRAADVEVGAVARRRRTATLDEKLRGLLSAACTGRGGASLAGVAVVALGSYGRSQPAPGSDLDLVLLHDSRRSAAELAEAADAVWYPLWDAGYRLDHAVRTVAEAVTTADQDVRTALDLLDARHVAGDPELTMALRAWVLADWRRRATRRLPELRALVDARAARTGELSQRAEPDLKNSYGGLRDATVLQALVASWLVDVPHQVVRPARTVLLDVRDALHLATGRPSRLHDRLVADRADETAVRSGMATDRASLLRVVHRAGRDIAHASDVSWRRVDAAVQRASRTRRPGHGGRAGPVLAALDLGVGVADGEVVLAPTATPLQDPLLALRAAAAAARARLPLSDAACARLARTAAPIPTPWPEEARRLLCALLGAGSGLPGVWESLDLAGVVAGWLPEWEAVQMQLPRSPVHLFTVDRHLVQTCVHAAAELRGVGRPDVLLVAALLHDIGKGRADGGTDHAALGAPVAARIARRWGFAPAASRTIGLLVRHHLLLAETATRRDLDDPRTADSIAGVVGDADTLDLLAALTVADARATGPQAASGWRLGLVRTLAGRVRDRLRRAPSQPAVPVPPAVPPQHNGVGVRMERDPGWQDRTMARLVIAAPVGTLSLATVAGVLALERLPVRRARVYAGGSGLSEWLVGGADGLDQVRLRGRLDRAVRDGGARVAGRLRDRAAQPSRARSTARIEVLADAAAGATVLEIRADDRDGLVFDICRSLARAAVSVRSAHVCTLGASAVDVFYVTDPDGRPLGADRAAQVASTLRRTLATQPSGW